MSSKTIFIITYTEYNWLGECKELAYLNFVHYPRDIFTIFQHFARTRTNAALVYLSSPVKTERVLDLLKAVSKALKWKQQLPHTYEVKSNHLQALVEQIGNEWQAFTT